MFMHVLARLLQARRLVTLVDLLYEEHTLTPGAVKLCVSAEVPPHELFLPLLGAAGAQLCLSATHAHGGGLRRQQFLAAARCPVLRFSHQVVTAAHHIVTWRVSQNGLCWSNNSMCCCLLSCPAARQGVNPNLGRSSNKLDVKALIEVRRMQAHAVTAYSCQQHILA